MICKLISILNVNWCYSKSWIVTTVIFFWDCWDLPFHICICFEKKTLNARYILARAQECWFLLNRQRFLILRLIRTRPDVENSTYFRPIWTFSLRHCMFRCLKKTSYVRLEHNAGTTFFFIFLRRTMTSVKHRDSM